MIRGLSACLAVAFCTACSGDSMTSPTTSEGRTADAALFTRVTESDPFRSYAPFPNLPGNASGILSGSSAHVPRIRVSMNALAMSVLRNGRLPSGATFPDGAVVFKEVLADNGETSVYAVMVKDRGNALAENGWLWAEYRPDGETVFGLANRGNACTGCHALDQGSLNDFVRSFERQP